MINTGNEAVMTYSNSLTTFELSFDLVTFNYI